MTPSAISTAAIPFSRREFLRFGSAGSLGVLGHMPHLEGSHNPIRYKRMQLLYVLLSGGPGQLDTFDPKPDAPGHIRGPFRTVASSITGIHFADTLPELSKRAHHLTVFRALTSSAAPLHETGMFAIQTGTVPGIHQRVPHLGSLVSGDSSDASLPAWVILPKTLGDAGSPLARTQMALATSDQQQPVCLSCDGPKQAWDELGLSRARTAFDQEAPNSRSRYPNTDFGQHCRAARVLLEAGVSCVTLNMFPRLEGGLSWDCHGYSQTCPTTFQDYRDTVCPDFDKSFSTLLDDLNNRGMLATTLVVAVGEFGRTPLVNRHGGRDHWNGVWSAIVAGAGMPAGTIVGASDRHAAQPQDHPLTPGEFITLLKQQLGIHTEETQTLAKSA